MLVIVLQIGHKNSEGILLSSNEESLTTSTGYLNGKFTQNIPIVIRIRRKIAEYCGGGGVV